MKNINIGNKIIGGNNKCFIIFDGSATYSNFEEAKELIKASSSSGADAIKFQLIITGDAEKIMAEKDILVNYSNKQERVFDALKRRELTLDEWKKLKQIAEQEEIIMITIPSFPHTVKIIEDLKIEGVKIAKGNMNNVLFIDRIAKSKKTIFFDAREKITYLEKAMEICKNNNNNRIIILHYPSSFPQESMGVHLNSVIALQEKFDCPIGFGNHSSDSFLDYAAIGFGIDVLEKTITSNKNKDGVGHSTSLQINELKSFVDNIRIIENSFGSDNILCISRVEDSAKRSISALRDIQKGENISLDNIEFRRPGNEGISAEFGFDILKKKAKIDIKKGRFLKWDLLE